MLVFVLWVPQDIGADYGLRQHKWPTGPVHDPSPHITLYIHMSLFNMIII